MRKKLTHSLVAFSFVNWAQNTVATPTFSELFPVAEQSVIQLSGLVTASRGLLTRAGDTRDERFFVLVASEGSGIVQYFTYLYLCGSPSSCRLVSMYRSVNHAVDVKYDQLAGQFKFSVGMKTVMQVAARLPAVAEN
jgi:hypothetical protein